MLGEIPFRHGGLMISSLAIHQPRPSQRNDLTRSPAQLVGEKSGYVNWMHVTAHSEFHDYQQPLCETFKAGRASHVHHERQLQSLPSRKPFDGSESKSAIFIDACSRQLPETGLVDNSLFLGEGQTAGSRRPQPISSSRCVLNSAVVGPAAFAAFHSVDPPWRQ